MRITTISKLYTNTCSKLDIVVLRESSNVDQSNFEIDTNGNPWSSRLIFFCNFRGKRVNVKISKVGFMLFYCNTYWCFCCCMCFSVCWINIIYFPRLMLLCRTQKRKCNISFRKGLRIKELKQKFPIF